jgi:hypothetical protein
MMKRSGSNFPEWYCLFHRLDYVVFLGFIRIPHKIWYSIYPCKFFEENFSQKQYFMQVNLRRVTIHPYIFYSAC